MNIVEFYKRLSKILEMCREKTITHSDAEFRLKTLLEEAEKAKLDVKIDDKILTLDNLINYDDENSYEDYEDSSYESSYDEENESSY
jgi:hypothetical protein